KGLKPAGPLNNALPESSRSPSSKWSGFRGRFAVDAGQQKQDRLGRGQSSCGRATISPHTATRNAPMAGQERTRPRNGLSSELAMGDLEQGNKRECGRIPSNGRGSVPPSPETGGAERRQGTARRMIPRELEIRTGSKKRQRFWATSSGAGRRTF